MAKTKRNSGVFPGGDHIVRLSNVERSSMLFPRFDSNSALTVPYFDFSNTKMTGDLYLVGLKGNKSGSFGYGRNSYDYEEGTLTFIAPNQVLAFNEKKEGAHEKGWTILFHPDLIRKSELGRTIKEYSFFDYDTNEALHVSDKEKGMLNVLVEYIETELQQNIDQHSQELIISNLETLLKYCRRYYDRQFYTRTNLNKDYITRFEQYLEVYFSSDELLK